MSDLIASSLRHLTRSACGHRAVWVQHILRYPAIKEVDVYRRVFRIVGTAFRSRRHPFEERGARGNGV